MTSELTVGELKEPPHGSHIFIVDCFCLDNTSLLGHYVYVHRDILHMCFFSATIYLISVHIFVICFVAACLVFSFLGSALIIPFFCNSSGLPWYREVMRVSPWVNHRVKMRK